MRLLALCLLMVSPFVVHAQSTSTFPMRLNVESAFVRAAPTPDADAVSSVFMETALRAVGRNIDGTWLELARPAGWISRTVVVFTFDVTALPITDLTTGVVGAVPVVDSGFTVQTIDDAPLYTLPERRAAIIETIPPYAALPVVERTPDNQWVAVNYRGVIGWLPQFLLRQSFSLESVPISPAYAADARYPAVVVVPRTVQIAQIERLEAYIDPLVDLSAGIAAYWQGIITGSILECTPYPPNIPYYSITAQDIIELPELRQQERLLTQAVDDLNESLTVTANCGILVDLDLRGAYGNAINANGIFELVRDRLDEARRRVG